MSKRNPRWTEALLREAASQYSTRSEFATSNKPAYEAARLAGLIDELFGHVLNQWEEESIRTEAAKYKSRTEFAKMSGSAYNAARRLGIIDDLYDSLLMTWTPKQIRFVAQLCANKKEMKRQFASAYNAALRLGIISDLFQNQRVVNTRDCIYLWSVVGERDLYKFGITSKSMGDHRIKQVSREAGVTPSLVMLHHVGYEDAKRIEKLMKGMGRPYKFSKKFFGFSEFRYLSPDEVAQCVRLALDAVKQYRLTRGI